MTCVTNKKDSKVTNGLIAAPIAGGSSVTLLAGKGSFSGITTDPHFKALAFTSDAVEQAEKAKKEAAEEAKKKAEEAQAKATAGAKIAKATAATKAKDSDEDDDKRSRHDIYTWDFGAGPARMVVTNDTDGIPEDYTISSSGLSWSGNGAVLSFSIRGKSDPKLAKILPVEKVVVDIWHWNEGKIQPMQAKARGRSSSKSRSCVWHVDAKRLVVLGDEAISSPRVFSRDGSKAMGSDSKPYEKLVSWDGRYSDYYMINTSNGKRTKIVEQTANRPSPSPSGRYMMHFGDDYKWYLIETAGMSKKRLTLSRHIQWENELEDRPQAARAYGVVGWTQGEEAVLINDRYDIWKFVIKTNKVTCVTNLFGRQNKIVLRYSKFDLEGDDDEIDADNRSYIPNNMWLSAKNERTKDSGYYIASVVEPGDPKKVVMSEDAIGGVTRAKKAERIFFTLSDFDRYPDVWVAGMDFSNQRQLTDACPEQRAVRWGSSELVNWTNSDGLALQGYLVKPEGFDPKKKYPMMVYFYERNSDRVHSYVRPTPGTSPNAAYYVSNGYLWFVPDIVYTVGYPGESAEKCVISGVQHLIARGYVNKKAIGMAGHSWGGYQTAHLATRSNLFAAAESGAPVSNMFSAYGGIRYQTGMSRQFQYEKTQSRIGGTPWEYPQRYWQNSPVFYADRVQTPMLILHNDNDGAVPWTNGIEFFMALRRMGKEAYLFNYNGEPHGIRKDANKRDWARRMQEFFDHHLKGEPAVAWMTKGVPYAEREKEKIQYARSIREAEAEKKIKAVEATSGSRKAGKR
jgi:dipeptidyl aminopeptidase/acylaminoacyl peptidase